MIDPIIFIFSIVILLVIFITIILALIFERKSLIEQNREKENKLLDEQSKLVKALISKNANDYVMTAAIDRVPAETETPKENNDEVELDALGQDDWEKAIGVDRKKDKK